MISKAEYQRLAATNMRRFELLHRHAFFPDNTPLPLLHELRYRWIINALTGALASLKCYTPQSSEVNDCRIGNIASFGCFPGSLDRIIKGYFSKKIRISGIGLSITDNFRQELIPKIYDNIYEVELDPLHPGNLTGKYPVTVPLKSDSMDAVIAGEILEHLYSPVHFLSQISRILKPGGFLILTTPNVCYIGNIIKLVTGRSCHESLSTSHIYMHSEWRAHIRVYDRHEIARLCSSINLEEIETRFLNNGEDAFYKSARIRLKMLLLKLFYIVPHYRNNLCQVFRKKKCEDTHAHSD